MDRAGLRAYLAARDDADPAVAPGMRSIVLDGERDETILLLHGLTASPPAWSAIASDLQARGFSVVVPRLPLHGHRDRLTPALARLTTPGLLADVADIIGATVAACERVAVGGVSLGGALALWAASRPTGIVRAVAIAPFLGIARVPSLVQEPLAAVFQRVPERFVWWDPVLRERQLPEHGYPRYPLGSLGAALGIATLLRRAARIRARVPPIAIVINESETSVNNRVTLALARRWRRAGAPIVVHRLTGLPPSHDIVDPAGGSSARARATLVALLAGEPSPAQVHPL